MNSVGITTARDRLTIHYTEEELWRTVQDFATLPADEARAKYKLGNDARDWKVEFAQQDLEGSGPSKDRVVPITYRPFDVRYTYYTGHSRGFHCMPRGAIMRHMFSGNNLGLCVSKGKEVSGKWEQVFCTDRLMQHHTVSLKEVNYLFPLYLYAPPEGEERKSRLFKDGDPFKGKERIENFSPQFRAFLHEKYEHNYDPENILGYVYAVLHCPAYREKYRDFLKTDFPRVPFADERQTFEALSTLGQELI